MFVGHLHVCLICNTDHFFPSLPFLIVSFFNKPNHFTFPLSALYSLHTAPTIYIYISPSNPSTLYKPYKQKIFNHMTLKTNVQIKYYIHNDIIGKIKEDAICFFPESAMEDRIIQDSHFLLPKSCCLSLLTMGE